jgi:FkbM family methyltransferase
MDRNINITSFDEKDIVVNFNYLGDRHEEVIAQIRWKGATVFRCKFTFTPDSAMNYFMHINEGQDCFDEIDVFFMGLGWEEEYRLARKVNNPKIDYENLPRIHTHYKDSAFVTYAEIFVDQMYENKVAPIESGDTVVDIGANYGFFVLYAASKKVERVIAYEPSNIVFRYLNENTQHLDNVKTRAKAVGGQNGKATFYDEIDNVESPSSASSRLESSQGSDDLRHLYEVDVITLEDIFVQENLRKIDYLKIDCEGAELDILSKTPSHRFQQINKMCVETHSEEISIGVKAILESQGFHFEIHKNDSFDVYYAKNPNFQKKKIVLIGSFCDNEEKEDVLVANIKIIKDLGIDVLVYSPLDLKNPDISKEADFFFKTKENPLLLWPQRAYTHWLEIINKNGKKLTLHRGLPDYGWAGLYQIKKMSEIALTYDYDTFIHMIYDVEIDEFLKKEILSDEVNFLHPRRDFHNPGGVWDATLHFMVFDRMIMRTIADSIQLHKYTDSNGMAEHHALGWVYDYGITISTHPVTDKIYYWKDRDIFSYSKSSSYKIFWSKNQDTDLELKVVFSDFDESSSIKLVVNGIEYTNIENWVYISTSLNSADITSFLVHHEGEVIDYTDDYVKTMRNLIYYA